MAAVDEERIAMVLDASDATATTTDVEGAPQVEGGLRAQPSNGRVLKLAGVAGAAALVAGALVATAMAAARATSGSAPQSSGVVELQGSGLVFSYKTDTGCSNWNQILIAKVPASSMHNCLLKCAETAECATGNFQDAPKGSCTPAGEGTVPNTCYLYRQGCDEEENKCWTLGFVGRNSKIAYKVGVGCSNWKSLKLDKSKQLTNVDCAERCAATAGCTSSNFQDQPDGSCMPNGEGAGQYTCYLYSGTCMEENNPCWSLAEVAQPNSPTIYTEGVGCSNWASIEFDRSTQPTRMMCAARCAATAACVGMNFQGLPSGQCSPAGEGAGQNSCFLYSGACNEEPNPCWALGYMFASGPGPGPGTTTAGGGVTTTLGTTIGATTTTDAVSTTA